MTAAKEALGAQTVPTTYTDINLLPVEIEKTCRPETDLQFLGANGIFTSVTKDKFSVTVRGNIIEVISYNLKLNPKHAINPGGIVPGCNSDDVMAIAAGSVNVSGVAATSFTKTNGRVTSVSLFFTRTNKSKPATLAVRVKFEENGGTGLQFIPRRKVGLVAFP